MTLEQTPGGAWLDAKKLFDAGSPLTKQQAYEVWSLLSKRYASEASGTAVGFVEGSSPTSVFNTTEWPTLLGNQKITNVITNGH